MKLNVKTSAIQFASALAIGLSILPTPSHALDAAGEGRRLWLKFNCYGCHGMTGTGGMGPKLRGDSPEYGDVYEKVMQGADEGMPSYHAYMTTTDIRNLATYLATMGRSNEPKFTHWWEPIPSR